MRKTIKVEKLYDEIRNNVEYCMSYISRGNKEMAFHHANTAMYLFRTACYMLIDTKVDFSSAYDEIAEISNINQLYTNMEISDYIHNKIF